MSRLERRVSSPTVKEQQQKKSVVGAWTSPPVVLCLAVFSGALSLTALMVCHSSATVAAVLNECHCDSPKFGSAYMSGVARPPRCVYNVSKECMRHPPLEGRDVRFQCVVSSRWVDVRCNDTIPKVDPGECCWMNVIFLFGPLPPMLDRSAEDRSEETGTISSENASEATGTTTLENASNSSDITLTGDNFWSGASTADRFFTTVRSTLNISTTKGTQTTTVGKTVQSEPATDAGSDNSTLPVPNSSEHQSEYSSFEATHMPEELTTMSLTASPTSTTSKTPAPIPPYCVSEEQYLLAVCNDRTPCDEERLIKYRKVYMEYLERCIVYVPRGETKASRRGLHKPMVRIDPTPAASCTTALHDASIAANYALYSLGLALGIAWVASYMAKKLRTLELMAMPWTFIFSSHLLAVVVRTVWSRNVGLSFIAIVATDVLVALMLLYIKVTNMVVILTWNASSRGYHRDIISEKLSKMCSKRKTKKN